MLARGPAPVLDALAPDRAVCRAAGTADPPVVLQVGSTSIREISRPMPAAAALAAAGEASVPVGVHRDHSTDLEEIRPCVALRDTPVMADGSHLPFAENAALTRVVVDEAHDAGVWVEAELGVLESDEDASTGATAGVLSEPAQAAAFVERTDVDVLAPAVGTVHGSTTRPVHVDLERLAIAELTGVPLGAARRVGPVGRPRGRGAGRRGEGQHQRGAAQALPVGIGRGVAERADDIRVLQRKAIDAMAEVAAEKLGVLSGAGSAVNPERKDDR
jgi:fructose-bisphosphate aldolase class II/tagatose 1,6-diphosphate aldolase GatY/KbaY